MLDDGGCNEDLLVDIPCQDDCYVPVMPVDMLNGKCVSLIQWILWIENTHLSHNVTKVKVSRIHVMPWPDCLTAIVSSLKSINPSYCPVQPTGHSEVASLSTSCLCHSGQTQVQVLLAEALDIPSKFPEIAIKRNFTLLFYSNSCVMWMTCTESSMFIHLLQPSFAGDLHFRHESKLPICWTWDLNLVSHVGDETASHYIKFSNDCHVFMLHVNSFNMFLLPFRSERFWEEQCIWFRCKRSHWGKHSCIL